LHPRPDEGQRLTEPEKPEVAVSLKGAERIQGGGIGHVKKIAARRLDLGIGLDDGAEGAV
jgi:hypothetical protein